MRSELKNFQHEQYYFRLRLGFTAFVLDERIALAVCTECHAVAQFIHGTQVVLPLLIDTTQKDATLHVGQYALVF